MGLPGYDEWLSSPYTNCDDGPEADYEMLLEIGIEKLWEECIDPDKLPLEGWKILCKSAPTEAAYYNDATQERVFS